MRSPYAKWLLIGLALTLLIPGFSFASKQDTLNTEFWRQYTRKVGENQLFSRDF